MYYQNILSLESMKFLSIDEIVGLYRQGYILESKNYIQSLPFTDCSGTEILDRQNTSSGAGFTILKNVAESQRFIPTSRCLKNITLGLRRYINEDLYVEIRSDSAGLPAGNPHDSNNRLGYAVIPFASIPTTTGEVLVTLDIVLPDLSPVWIVICLDTYDASSSIPDVYYRVDGGSGTGSVSEYEAYKIGTTSWVKTTDSLFFKTSKLTYSSTSISGGGAASILLLGGAAVGLMLMSKK